MATRFPQLSVGLAGLPIDYAMSMAKEADDQGFYSTTVGELVRDVFVYLAALAVNTKNIKLVTGIATWTRTPVTTMRACRDMQLLSKGRFVFGIGSMPKFWNKDYHDIDPDRPLARMREFVDVLGKLYSAPRDTKFYYAGEFYQINGYLPYEDPPPYDLPIYIGASMPKMFRFSGEKADGVLFNTRHTVPWVKQTALPAIEEGLHKAGRTRQDIHLHASCSVIFTDNAQEFKEAFNNFRHMISRTYLNVDYHQKLMIDQGLAEEVAMARKALAKGDDEGFVGAVSENMFRTYNIVGTVDECLEGVAKYTGAVDSLSLDSPVGNTIEEKIKATRRIMEVFRLAPN
jgi:5,10-methylenetetrahydromethanopterin reductase